MGGEGSERASEPCQERVLCGTGFSVSDLHVRALWSVLFDTQDTVQSMCDSSSHQQCLYSTSARACVRPVTANSSTTNTATRHLPPFVTVGEAAS